MIDEARTLEIFGYNAKDLAPHSHKKIVAICEECGNVRVITLQQYTRNERKLCMSCSRKGKHATAATREKLRIINTGRKQTQETKDKISAANMGKKRSAEQCDEIRNIHLGMTATDETKTKMSISRFGENNPNWKGGITQWRKSLHASSAYKNWRAAVFERDNYTCQMCNVRGGYLQAHHIEPVRDNKNTLLIFDVNNGITLCKDCHNKTKHNKEYDFIEQFKNIIENTNKKD